MTVLEDWIDTVCRELGLDRGAVDERAILDLARVVAHQVDRPAAPVSAFLVGIAVGQGKPLAPTADRLAELAAAWQGDGPAD
jgi:hypothetical protein